MSLPKPTLIGAALLLALSTGGGCAWIKSKVQSEPPYQDSRMSRPLEMPPGLDAPSSAGGMAIPDVGHAGMTAPVQPPGLGAPAAPQGVREFFLDDELDSAYRRIGLALERLEGVELLGRAQLLHSFDVRYQGQTLLLRAERSGERVRVTALGSGGQPQSGGAGAQLLGLLQARLQ